MMKHVHFLRIRPIAAKYRHCCQTQDVICIPVVVRPHVNRSAEVAIRWNRWLATTAGWDLPPLPERQKDLERGGTTRRCANRYASRGTEPRSLLVRMGRPAPDLQLVDYAADRE